MDSKVHAFIDTNIFLHYKPLSQIDWCKVLSARSVELMLCLPVIEELDEKKSDSRLADRANRSIKDVERHGLQGELVRENVGLTIYAETLSSEDLASNTFPDSKDEQIVLVAKKYKRVHSDREVCIISEDLGMKVRCRAYSIPVHSLDPSQRLQNPGDEKDKKIKEIQNELVRYKNRLPVLSVTLLPHGQSTDDRKPYSVKLTKSWVEQDVEIEVQKQRKKYPKYSDPKKSFLGPGSFAMDHYVKAVEWAEYDTALETYFENYKNYVVMSNYYRKNKELMATLAVVLHNDGTLPATDIDLHLVLPKKLEHLSFLRDAPNKAPEPPKPPSSPNGLSLIVESFASKSHGISHYNPRLPDPPKGRDPLEPTIDIRHGATSGHIIHIKLPRLKHEHYMAFGPFSAGFASWDDVSPCDVEYSISTSELLSSLEGKITVFYEKVIS